MSLQQRWCQSRQAQPGDRAQERVSHRDAESLILLHFYHFLYHRFVMQAATNTSISCHEEAACHLQEASSFIELHFRRDYTRLLHIAFRSERIPEQVDDCFSAPLLHASDTCFYAVSWCRAWEPIEIYVWCLLRRPSAACFHDVSSCFDFHFIYAFLAISMLSDIFIFSFSLQSHFF